MNYFSLMWARVVGWNAIVQYRKFTNRFISEVPNKLLQVDLPPPLVSFTIKCKVAVYSRMIIGTFSFLRRLRSPPSARAGHYQFLDNVSFSFGTLRPGMTLFLDL